MSPRGDVAADLLRADGSVVLITDGDVRASLAATRSLIRAGHTVYVAASGSTSLAGASRGARPLTVSADPLHEPEAYAREIAALVDRAGARVLLPTTDPSVDAVLRNRACFDSAMTLPLPSLGAYERASDKVAMSTLARASGLGVPMSVTIASPDELRVLADFPHYPAVVKPRASVVATEGRARRKLGVRIVDTPAAAEAYARLLPADAFPLLLQQRVHGPGEGIFLLRWNGRVYAEFAHRRLREIPPSGGVSVYRESIAVAPGLAAAARTMFDTLDWQGVAMVECKRDLATGTHMFMEINGRLWGSLQLAIDAGVDFPAQLVALALGEPVPEPTAYREGVRSRWFWGEMDHLYARFRHRNQTLHLDETAPSRLRAVAALFQHVRGRDRWEIARRGDPGPFLLETRRRLGLSR